jgi:type IV secretory pathway VirB10-like protein
MRTRSILTTAASVLLASTVYAAAQGTQKQGPGGEGAPTPSQTQQHEGQQGKQAPQKGERRENAPQKGSQVQEREGSSKQQQQGKQETQKEQRGESKGKAERNDAAQRNERNERNDAAQRGERNERGERNDAQRGEQRTGDAGHKTLTVEQKTKVRETVLRGGNAPRVTSVNFNVSVGTVVPTTVRVVELPPVLVEYYPDWRGYLYFVYNDEIIIVDRNHRIVAVLEV